MEIQVLCLGTQFYVTCVMSLLSLLHYVEHALFSTYIKPRYETNFFLMLNYREQTRLGLTLYSRLY